MPTLPVPANKSKKQASSTCVERMSKSAVFTRSIIGRVPTVLGVFNLHPLASPVTTRIVVLLLLRNNFVRQLEILQTFFWVFLFIKAHRSYCILCSLFRLNYYMCIMYTFLCHQVPQSFERLTQIYPS